MPVAVAGSARTPSLALGGYSDHECSATSASNIQCWGVVSSDGALWMGTHSGKVWRYLAGSWETIAMPLKELAAAGIPEVDARVTGI
ncbi:MAG TPA: hypothetical protein VNO21_14580, partial [Polyangiaceae bacterium]|nr:hypothetical protein [Polyangiaceae bacterium]